MKNNIYVFIFLILCILSFGCKNKSPDNVTNLENVDPISYLEGKNDSKILLASSSAPQLPDSIVKLEAEMDRRAKIMAEERKLKDEKPVKGVINDWRILNPNQDDNPAGKSALDKLSPKCKFAYWYIQYSVDFYFAYYHHPPKDIEEFVEKNYLPFTLTNDEIEKITNVLMLIGWNLNDKTIALREIRFEKMQSHPKYSKEEHEKRLPYFMFNLAFTLAMNSYLPDVHRSFKPEFSEMYEFVKTEFGVNEKFWEYVVDNNGKLKGKAIFIKEGSDERLPANSKLEKGDLLVTYYKYTESECGCHEIPPDLIGKVWQLSTCILH